MLFYQFESFVYAAGQLMWIMCHIYQCLSGARTEFFYDGGSSDFVAGIQTVQRLVQDNQVRVFDERPGEQGQTLLSGR